MRLALAVLLAFACYAETLRVESRYQPGQVLHLELTKSREDTRVGRAFATTTPITARVLSVTPAETVIDWVPGETTANPPQILSDPMVGAALSVLRDLHLEVRLDADGAFAGLRNQQQVESRLHQATAVMARTFADRIPEPARRKQFLEMFSRILPPSAVAASAVREIDLWFALSGAELETGVPISISRELPNPLGGEEKLPSMVEITLKQVNELFNQAEVEIVQNIDAAALASTIEKLVAQTGQPIPKDTPRPTITIADKATYIIDLRTRRLSHVTHTRIVEAGSMMKRTDITKMRFVRTDPQ